MVLSGDSNPTTQGVRQSVQPGDDGRNRCSDGTSRNLFMKRTPGCSDEPD